MEKLGQLAVRVPSRSSSLGGLFVASSTRSSSSRTLAAMSSCLLALSWASRPRSASVVRRSDETRGVVVMPAVGL